MIDYCCQRFEGLLSLGDDRGMSMIIKRNVKFGDFYFVRFRAVARDDDDRLGSADVPVEKLSSKQFNTVRGVGRILPQPMDRLWTIFHMSLTTMGYSPRY